MVVAAYDFRNTNPASFDVNVWYNDTFANRTIRQPSAMIRVSRSLNMVSTLFLLATEGTVIPFSLPFLSSCVLLYILATCWGYSFDS